MLRIIIGCIVFIGLVSSQTYANEVTSENGGAEIKLLAEGTTPLEIETDENHSTLDVHWDFITCVHNSHECSDEAHHHGYHHYKVVHDHHMCHGHADYACYGGHH